MYDYEVLSELDEVLDRLNGTEPAALADGESIEALHRCLTRLDAVATRATASFDASREWEADGARSASSWLAATCHLPQAGAKRCVRLGRALRHLPVAEEAWLGGDIGAAQVSVLATARTPSTEKAMARDEEMLVGFARRLRFSAFSRAVTYWRSYADPNGSEKEASDQREGRRLNLSQSFDGTWLGDFVLDPIAGSIVAKALSRIEDELFAADWSEARERLGEAAGVGDLARTTTQRRADALVEMARRARSAHPDGRRPEPLFTVLVGYETVAGRICELANGTVVSPGSLVRWLDQAWVERVVFDGASRVIDVGVATRLFTGATRRAVEVRDRQCFHESCEIPAERCQIDHVQPWVAGGPTVAANGRPACAFHNRNRHRRP